MDERVMQFRVGVMVLATIIISVILVLLFGELPELFRGNYELKIRFPSAPGIAPDTPVRTRGLLIGRVTDVELEDDHVLVTVSIDSDVKLRRDMRPRVVRSLLGDSFIEFVPSKEVRERVPPADQRQSAMLVPVSLQQPVVEPEDYLEPGETIPGVVPPEPLEAVTGIEPELREAIQAIAVASDEVREAARRFNVLLANNQDQVARIINKTEASLDRFQITMAGINDILGDPQFQQDLRQALQQLPGMLTDLRGAFADIRIVLELAEQNLQNIAGFTAPLGERGPQLVARLEQTLARLDTLFGQFVEFGRQLTTGEGTIGKLLNDPALYNQVYQIACNVRALTERLKPIIEDVRVFANRVARYPELLGVRGAIDPSSGIR